MSQDISYGNWLNGGEDTISNERRAARVWALIQRTPASIIVDRNQVLLTAQTVRVEPDSGGQEAKGYAGSSGKQMAMVFGVRGHGDDDILDTNLQRDDRFDYGGQIYRVVNVQHVPGGIQAKAESMDS